MRVHVQECVQECVHVRVCACVCHLIVGVLDDPVQRWHQGLLQVQAACVAGDAGFW